MDFTASLSICLISKIPVLNKSLDFFCQLICRLPTVTIHTDFEVLSHTAGYERFRVTLCPFPTLLQSYLQSGS